MMEKAVLQDALEYDPSTGIFRWKVSPAQAVRVGSVAGTVHPHDRHIFYRGKSYSARRLAWLFMTGEWPTHDVANANGAIDDCRWANLVPTSHRERAIRQHAEARQSASRPGGGSRLSTS